MAANTAGEPARLAAVRALGLIGAEPDPEMADVTALAADLLGAPIAPLSLMDERRQVFIARHGVTHTEAPRSAAFCSHVVALAEPLVVLDARHDPRFASNPFVLGPPHVRFYAGEPLLSDDGFCIGTLCIIDPQPRAGFSSEDHVKLQRLARLAAQLLRTHAIGAERDQARAQKAETEHLYNGIVDEAAEAISACDRVAAFVHRRLTPALVRAHKHVAEIADAAAPVETRHSKISALSEIAGVRELVDDMHAIARFDAHLAKGRVRALEPSMILREVVHGLAANATKRGVTFRLDDRAAGFEMHGDELKLEEALDQLLSDLVAQSKDATLRVFSRFEALSGRALFALTVSGESPCPESGWRLGGCCRDLISAIGGAWEIATDEHRVSICLPARLRTPVRADAAIPSNVISFQPAQREQS